MNKEALENFRKAGLLQDEYLGNGGTLPLTINGKTEDADVSHHHTFPNEEVLYMPVNVRQYKKVLANEIFSTMGGE